MNLEELMDEIETREKTKKFFYDKYNTAVNDLEEIKQIKENSSLFDKSVIYIISELVSIKENKYYVPFIIRRVEKDFVYDGLGLFRKKLYRYRSSDYIFIDTKDNLESLSDQKEIVNYVSNMLHFSDDKNLFVSQSYVSEAFLPSEKIKDALRFYVCDFNKDDKERKIRFLALNGPKKNDKYCDGSIIFVRNCFKDFNYVFTFIEHLFDLQVQNNGRQLTNLEMQLELNDFLESEKQKEVKASKVKVRKIKKPNNNKS